MSYRLPLKRMAGSLNCISNGAVNVAAHADFAVTNGSLECWMRSPNRMAQAVNPSILFSILVDVSNYINVNFNSGSGTGISTVYFRASGLVTIICTGAGASIDNGAWHHIIVTWSSLGAFIYVDGVQTGTQSGDRRSTFGANPTIVMANAATGGSNSVFGNMCRARMYNVALTAAQVLQRYQGIDIQTGLISDWRCDDMAGLTVTDYKSAHNGTISDIAKIYWSPNTPVKERVMR